MCTGRVSTCCTRATSSSNLLVRWLDRGLYRTPRRCFGFVDCTHIHDRTELLQPLQLHFELHLSLVVAMQQIVPEMLAVQPETVDGSISFLLDLLRLSYPKLQTVAKCFYSRVTCKQCRPRIGIAKHPLLELHLLLEPELVVEKFRNLFFKLRDSHRNRLTCFKVVHSSCFQLKLLYKKPSLP
jgi:hypothetical protein